MRLLVLLARFAGLRTPSEHYALTWADVDFEHDRMIVRAPKTGGVRYVPILDDVRGELLKAHGDAATGATHVFARRFAVPYIRRVTEQAILRAGLVQWPRLYQNLRASFATDCVRSLPANQAALVLGHGQNVAAQSYWTATEADFGALQKALRQTHADAGGRSHDETANGGKSRTIAHTGADTSNSRMSKVGPAGLEPATSGL
ncbi:MAG: tyrosine-type recombinase/integrase [Phycisphaerae bacterium]